MNKQVSDKCDETAMKIINIIDGLGFTVEKQSKYNELRTLITNEVRHCVSDIVLDFYKDAAIVPVAVEPIVVEKETDPKSFKLAQTELLEKFNNVLKKFNNDLTNLDKQNEQTNTNS